MTERNDGDAASQRSGASSNSGNMSETSSQQSDAKFLRKRALKGQHGANDETDLLEQKKSFQEGVFACMYTLVRQSALSQLAFAVLKVVLEFLMNFIVAFNPSFKTWRIDTSSPLWQVVRWAVWRSPIMRLYGYKTYVIVMYVMASLVLVAVVGLVWLTLAMRKQEQSKVLRTAATALHVVFDIMFVMCYVSFFDFFVFMADCSFLSTKEHLYFTGVACLEMPHLLHMLVALSAAALFLIVTALVVVASAELNPVSCAYLSTPASVVRLKILFTKAVYVILADCLDSHSRLQSLGMAAAVVLILYWNFRAMPFYRKTVNIVWTGLWGGVLYTCLVLNVVTFGKDQSPERHREMTKLVLLGIFPAILMTMLVQALYVWWAMRPARKFRNLELGIKLSKVYKFESVYEVERLARVMRKFDTEGLVEEDAAALGETIIKAGLQTFPNAPHLLILYANFVLEVRKDGPASRTQLQLAAKHSPDIIQRYQIFCTYEASKRLKGSQQDCMDLQAYTEFKRNFRAVLRVHREVLVMQAELWQLCMRPSLRVRQFDEALDALEAASSRANQVYKRVIERYPSNGKLLRCYGKFLEDARHDHVAAVRAYTAANRNGAGMALLSLDLSSGLHGGDKPDFLTSMSLEDDAVVVIDAEGTIMMVSQAVQKTFGYAKTELEGANVSILMPQPFSQRHDAYLSRYVASGEAQILDSVREVVALHKDRYVFPVALCVTRLSGVGTDSIFLGVIRPLPPDIRNLRAWIAPNGVFLCSDQQFASSIGVFEGDLVGHPLSSLAVNSEEVEALLERCKAASAAELASGEITAQLTLRHSYTAPVPMAAVVRLAGTDTQRILVLHCRRTDGLDGSMLAVDTHMRVKFASCEVALLLGYSMRKLASMRLDQLLPPPYNALHAKWLRDPPHVVPPASCRSGSVVHLQPESGFPVPVRLQISVLDNAIQGASTAAATLYVVQVHKVPADELFHEKRLVLTLDFAGKVLMVSPPDSAMFDFPALSLIGTNVSDSVDIFADWRQRSGDAQMQLILLALLYKEQEMPGTSWRVRVHRPESDKEAATAMSSLAAGSVRAGGSRRNSLSACLQVEMQDNRDEFQAIDRDGTGEHEPRVRVTLWRRDRLTSVLELDEELIIRRASPLTGLITGLPTSAMLRKPLSRFLNIPHSASWDKLVAATRQPGHGHHKKSALKATTDRGSISPVMAFIGPHPDSGTMRLMVQGVQTLGPGGRPKVTLTMHPDTTFVGAHANLMRVLRLNADIDRRATADGGAVADDDGVRSLAGGQARSRASSAWQSRTARKMKSMKQSAAVEEEGDGAAAGDALDALAAEAETKTEAELGANGDSESTNGLEGLGNSDEENAGRDGGGGEERPDSRSKQREVVKATRGELEDDNEDPGASLHRQSTSKSEFVAQWVRTLSHRVSGRLCLEAPLQQQPPGTPGGGEDGSSGGVLPQSRGSSRLAAAAACAPSRLSTIREAADAGAAEKQLDLATQPSSAGYLLHRVNSRRDWADAASMPQAGSPAAKSGGGASHRDSHEDDVEGGPVDAGKEEKAMSESGESSADGSQAAGSIISSATDATSVSEYMIDSRRGRLLKALHKQLLGPALMKHVDRLRLQSFLLIGIMFVAHVIAYSIITSMIKTEHDYVYSVHRQAMAMDRSQLIIVRSVAGAFCERANVTEKVSVCANSLSFTLDKLKTNIARMEEYHQGVYLGFDKNNVDRLSQNVYDVWTKHGLEYHVYMDTSSPQVMVATAGAWQLGNRFIAAAREALYLLPKLRDNYKLHRTYQFIKTNGLGPLFEGYAASLDMLVDAAWASIGKLRMDLLVTLVVEAIVVQLCCTCYELYLVQRTEWARLLGVLAMLGLPGPVLRQLASSDTRIVDDSDDESDDDDDDSRAGDEEERRGGATAARAGDNNSGDRDSAPDRDRDRGGAGLVPTAAPQLQSGDVAEPADVAGPLQRLERKPADLSNEPRANPAPKHVVRLLSGRRNLSNDGQVDGMAAPASAPSSKPGSPKLDVEERPLPAAGGQANAPALRAVSPRKAARTRGQQSISRFWMQINGKTLRPSFWNVAKFMVPFFLWNLAVILVYAVSLMKLNGMQGPLASLNMASHVTYRYTRVRAIALAFVTQDDAASRDVWRPMLLSELSLFESEYNAVMYGGEPSSMAKSTFRRVVPAGTFASSSFAQAFFRSKACFRYDKSTCFPPGHVYYEVTHNGLDVMVRRMLSEMKLLAEDADQDVAYNSSRYTFMAVVGANDLYEGLQQAAELFVDYSISRYVEVSILHTALLCISVALVLGFFVFVLWPHIRLLLRDAARLGALLSMVPPEMDVRAHVRGVLRRATGRALRQTLAAAATAATTPLATSAGASSGVDKSATTGRSDS